MVSIINKKTTNMPIITLNFVLISGLLMYLSHYNPTYHYYFSIFTPVSKLFWLFLFVSTLLAFGALIYYVVVAERRLNPLIVLPVVMLYIIYVLLPHLIYPLYGRGDMFTHYGFIKDILYESKITLRYHSPTLMNIDKYPMLHILGAIIVKMSDIQITSGMRATILVFNIVYLIGTLVLLGKLGKYGVQKKNLLLAIPLLFPLFGYRQILFWPEYLSFMTFPIFLSLLVFNDRTHTPYLIVISILLAFVVVAHPLSALYLVIITIMGIRKNDKTKIYLLAFFLVIWISWYFNIHAFVRNAITAIVSFFKLFFGDTEYNPFLKQQLQGINFASLLFEYPLPIAKTILYRYGEILITVLYSTYLLLCALWPNSKNRNFGLSNIGNISFLGAILVYLFSISLSGLSMFIFFINYERTFHILLFFSILTSTIFAEKSNTNLIKSDKTRLTIRTAVIVTVILLAIPRLYPTPLIREYNHYIPYCEPESMKGFFIHNDNTTTILGFVVNPMRFWHFLYGTTRYPPNVKFHGITPPPHLNITFKSYLIMNEIGEQYYPMVFPEFRKYWKITPIDVRRFRVQSNIIQSSYCINIYLTVRGEDNENSNTRNRWA